MVRRGEKSLAGWRRRFTRLSPYRKSVESGFTLLELIITVLIISILAAGAVPVARNLERREKERELKRTLREIRDAIDKFKLDCDQGKISKLEFKNPEKHSCYPESLEILQEGVQEISPGGVPGAQVVAGLPLSGKMLRYLRRIPVDPMTGKTEWGKRSVQDEPDSTSWGEENVFNVYSLHQGKAVDGKTYYKDW